MKQLISRHSISVALLAVGFVAGVFFVAAQGSTPSPLVLKGPEQSTGAATSDQGKMLLNQFSTAFESAAAKVNPSVVPIFSEQTTDVANPFAGGKDPFRDFFGDDFSKRFFGDRSPQKQTVRSLGSGVIVSEDGYILTNNHVVDGAEKVTVVLNDKKKYSAKVVGRDPQTDIAVVKIDAHGLPAAFLANSDEVKVGQWVIAVGNPFQLMHTVTAGIISAKGRSSMNLADYEDFIQTDASINPGNSGGALADLDGNVIGINTAIVNPSGVGGNVGIGFAIPINMAKSVMRQLVAGGKVTRGYLGLLPQDIDDGLAKALHLSGSKGSLVGDVTAGGPADKAGLKRGDVITTFNGTEVENSAQLRNMVAEAEPGKKATVGLLRDGKQTEVTVILGERPKDLATRSGGGEEAEPSTLKKFGLSVQELTPELARKLGYKNESGIVVREVTPGGIGDDAGLQPNDLIKEVNREAVHAAKEFREALDRAGKAGTVALLVRRGETTFYVALQATS